MYRLLIALVLAGMIIVPAADAAKQKPFLYAKAFIQSSDIAGISVGNTVYFAWETRNEWRVNVVSEHVLVGIARMDQVTESDSPLAVAISGTATESSIAGIGIGDTLTCAFDRVAETVDCGSMSGHTAYVVTR